MELTVASAAPTTTTTTTAAAAAPAINTPIALGNTLGRSWSRIAMLTLNEKQIKTKTFTHLLVIDHIKDTL